MIQPQLHWFEWFQREGLKELFKEINPISDHTGDTELRFIDYCFEDLKVAREECLARGLTYSAPLRADKREQ